MTLTKAELADMLFEKVGLNKREAKDMRLDAAQLADLAYGEVALRRDRRQAILGRFAFHGSARPAP